MWMPTTVTAIMRVWPAIRPTGLAADRAGMAQCREFTPEVIMYLRKCAVMCFFAFALASSAIARAQPAAAKAAGSSLEPVAWLVGGTWVSDVKDPDDYYTSESGQLTIGTATPDLDGKTTHQEFDVMQPNGSTNHIRSTIVRDGNDAYLFTVFMQQNGEWKQVFQITYKRKA